MSKELKKNEKAVLATNRKAYHNYHILEKFEAGIQLAGTEVKSCRGHNINLGDSFARVENGELFLYNAHISLYGMGNRFNHEPLRVRRLLMRKREILKLHQQVSQKGNTIVPLSFYLKGSLVKVELALASGKNVSDKRETMRKNEDDRMMRRIMSKFK